MQEIRHHLVAAPETADKVVPRHVLSVASRPTRAALFVARVDRVEYSIMASCCVDSVQPIVLVSQHRIVWYLMYQRWHRTSNMMTDTNIMPAVTGRTIGTTLTSHPASNFVRQSYVCHARPTNKRAWLTRTGEYISVDAYYDRSTTGTADAAYSWTYHLKVTNYFRLNRNILTPVNE